MKRAISLVLALVLCLALYAGCENDANLPTEHYSDVNGKVLKVSNDSSRLMKTASTEGGSSHSDGLDDITRILTEEDFTIGGVSTNGRVNYTTSSFAVTKELLECTKDKSYSVTVNGDSRFNLYYYSNGKYLGVVASRSTDIADVCNFGGFHKTGIDAESVTHIRITINYHGNKTKITQDNLADVVREFTFVQQYHDPVIRQSDLTDIVRMEDIGGINANIDELLIEMGHCTGKNMIYSLPNSVARNGITLTPNSVGKYTINGTATTGKAFGFPIYYSINTLPTGIRKGHTYRIGGDFPLGINMQVRSYDGTSWTALGAVSRTNTKEITIPEDAVGLHILLNINVGYTFDNAEIETEMISTASVKYVYDLMQSYHEVETPPPMLTIIDDDGYKAFERLLLPIIKEKKIPIASAVPIEEITTKPDKVMSWEQIENCALVGAEILSHTYGNIGREDVESNNMTVREIAYDYRLAQTHLRQHGIKAEGLVYVGDSSNYEPCVEACKQVYSYGFKADSGNKTAINEYGSTNRYGILRNGATGYSYEELTAMIDELVEKGTGWLVWMLHTSTNTYDETQVGYLEQAIDYAMEKGIQIVTTEYGVRTYCDE